MYELIILGVLTSGDKSGYALRNILENIFTTRRKVSSGVLYPRLDEFAKCGWITLYENPQDPRSARFAHLTEQGAQHFRKLMEQPVAYDSKREELLHFKCRFLGSVSVPVRKQILLEYQTYLTTDINAYQALALHMDEHIQRDDGQREKYHYVLAGTELDLTLAQTKLAWVEQQLTTLKGE
ncbi:PadR family transcriptional regulator [Periweissella ghanensis]|uniref:Transcription regulator PadR N-terminal domain-containing protein n=1 Tax=Periweissella ghanensis TaxID=467997 RepID=A0ABN8BMM8_9LACO|nr:PadR family transcriptional regulator [Periweissella ghanensis]MCM0600884.1 PadR family transcriptional regulator [Periweissella ghanensis]CAH0417699.1 hypothetical protein WGH24286_00111 [Periweissella ghanensis]